MIDPTAIDLTNLPSVALAEKATLPPVLCVYFAIDSQGVVQYIGKAVNLRQRWSSHHKYKKLSKMSEVSIAYLQVEHFELLEDMELALINWFKPPLNGRQSKFDDERIFEFARPTGVEPSPEAKRLVFIMRHLRQKYTCRQLARLTGVAQPSLDRMHAGRGCSYEAKEKLCRFLGRSIGDLQHYLSDDWTLEEFLSGASPVISRSLDASQILEELDYLTPSDLVEVVQKGLQLLVPYCKQSKMRLSYRNIEQSPRLSSVGCSGERF
jgi:DNA-binding Xre family transcriptional regulator